MIINFSLFLNLVGLYIPFISNFLIVLNIYNGDLIGIDENIEYMFWFILPLSINISYDIFTKNKNIYFSSYFIWILGILCNIYWYYFSPFKIGGIRHRTEYYDTRCLLTSMLYYHIFYFHTYLSTRN